MKPTSLYQMVQSGGYFKEQIMAYSPASVDSYHDIRAAINQIFVDYGDTVSVESKAKRLLKFGRNPGVQTTASTIWYTGQDDQNETYVADNTNSIDSISSSNSGDTEIVSVEGHTMSGGNRTFVTQTVTLTGQTRAALSTPLNRCTRVTHNQASSTSLVGEIYVYENTTISAGKPTDTTKIHLTVPAGENNSEKASTSLSSTDYWLVTKFHAGLQEKTANLLANVYLEWRPAGGVFVRASDPVVLSSGSESEREFDPYFVIPKNSDVRLVAEASTGNIEISGGIDGYLAELI